MATYITITNLKGGVGKTTTSGLLSKFFIEHRTDPVVLIDLDPQCGSTSLFLGKTTHRLTIRDILVSALEGNDTTEILKTAMVNVPGKPNLVVIPSDKRLSDMISRIPDDLLLSVFQSAQFSKRTIVIIDTGTAQGLISMGICAADMVLIPIMISKQTVRPTMNTLTLTARFRKPILGLLPISSGETQWEKRILDQWQFYLDESPDTKSLGGVVLPRIPYSKPLIRGVWIDSPFPEYLEPVFNAIYTRVFGKSALPVSHITEMLEVKNG